jgi:hypothetical protein
VRAAVDLDQFAEPGTSLTQLENASRPPSLRFPQLQFDLKPPHRLSRNRDPIQFEELFRRQRGAKVRVFVRQQSLHPLAGRIAQPVGRGTATPT